MATKRTAAEPPDAEPAERAAGPAPRKAPAKAAAKSATRSAAKAAARPVVKTVAKPLAPTVKNATPPAEPKPKPPVPPADAYDAAYATVDAVTAPARRRRRPSAAPTAPLPAEAAPAAPAPDGVTPAEPPVGDPPVAEPAWRAPTRRRAWASADVIGEAEERDPGDPVAEPEEARPPMWPAFEEWFSDDPEARRNWPVLVRAVRGDWLPALSTALPSLVALLLVAVVASGSLFVATKPDGDDLLVGDLPGGRWVRYVAAAVGLAFGGRLSFASEPGFDFRIEVAVRFVPLTVTAAALAALWWFARRAYQRNVTPDRLPDALRAAAVFAAGVGAVSWFARWTVAPPAGDPTDFETRVSTLRAANGFSVSPWRPAFWAFCAAFAVVWLATGRLVVTGRWAGWLLAARGALAGLGAGAAASLLLMVVLGYTYADRAGAESSDVTNAIPLVAAYAVGLGAAAFGVLAGGRVVVPVGEQSRWDLLAPHLPDAFLLLLVIPALSVAFAAWFLLRRPGVPRAEAVRACGRMGWLAAAAWLVVAVAGTPSIEQSFDSSGGVTVTSGPVLWSALAIGLWFGAGGWLAGSALDRWLPDPFDPGDDAT